MIEELKNKVIDTVELAKNLSEPRNKEEQQKLDDIYNEIQDTINFLAQLKNK